jgi:hypothetical protein
MKALDMSMLTAPIRSGAPLCLARCMGEAGDGRGVAALGDKHHPAVMGIGGDGQVIVAAPIGCLINRYRGHRRQVGRDQGEIDIARTDRMHAVP